MRKRETERGDEEKSCQDWKGRKWGRTARSRGAGRWEGIGDTHEACWPAVAPHSPFQHAGWCNLRSAIYVRQHMRWTLRGAIHAAPDNAGPGWFYAIVGREMRGRWVGLSPWAREVAPPDGAVRGAQDREIAITTRARPTERENKKTKRREKAKEDRSHAAAKRTRAPHPMRTTRPP